MVTPEFGTCPTQEQIIESTLDRYCRGCEESRRVIGQEGALARFESSDDVDCDVGVGHENHLGVPPQLY